MLILALDTTTRTGSCALARHGSVLREEASAPDQPPAARLPGDLMALLEAAGVALNEIDIFAVAVGPGSFTGLRIGIATMQGLAFAQQKPLIGISGLDALAAMASASVPSGSAPSVASGPPSTTDHLPTSIAPWVDAWRGEVYAARYENGRNVEAPVVGAPARLLEAVTAPTLFTGDGAAAHRDAIVRALGERASFTDPLVPRLAGQIALLAGEAAARGERPAPGAVRPLYVRRPDAELARDRA